MSWFETEASNKDPEGLRGEKKWRWDKDRVNAVLQELGISGKPVTSSASSSSLPSVLFVSLEKQPFFEDMYAETLATLNSKARVQEVTHIASAIEHLSKPQAEYAAVVVTDAGIIEKDFIAVQEKLVEYARTGGTVIFGFHLASFARPLDLAKFFKDKWALSWKTGDYHRETFTLSHQALLMNRQNPDLLPEYSMKALHLSGTKPEDRVYVASPNSAQSPAIFAKYGRGFLGYIGDVNTEDGTTKLLLAMCGI